MIVFNLIDCHFSFNTASVLIQLMSHQVQIKLMEVSIQLLFLFNKYIKLEIEKIDKFQYSFCSYSTGEIYLGKEIKQSFNTASVLIQHSVEEVLSIFWICFNTASVLIQQRSKKPRFIPTPVSIQLLFLFNSIVTPTTENRLMFQYSFCSYST